MLEVVSTSHIQTSGGSGGGGGGGGIRGPLEPPIAPFVVHTLLEGEFFPRHSRPPDADMLHGVCETKMIKPQNGRHSDCVH